LIYCPKCGGKNRPERRDCTYCQTSLPKRIGLRDLIQLMTVIILSISLLIGAYSVWQADKTLHANMKPILDIETSSNGNYEKVLYLHNFGMGTANISDIIFYNDSYKSKDVRDFIILSYNPTVTSHFFADKFTYIQKDQEMLLAKITSDSLKHNNNYSDTQIDEIMKEWTKCLNKVSVKITYEDMLGEKQKTLWRDFNFH